MRAGVSGSEGALAQLKKLVRCLLTTGYLMLTDHPLPSFPVSPLSKRSHRLPLPFLFYDGSRGVLDPESASAVHIIEANGSDGICAIRSVEPVFHTELLFSME